MTKLPIKKISRLLARHLRESERGKKQFTKSTAALDAAVALGAPLNVPIEITDRDGTTRVICVRDQFAEKNTAFSAKMFSRFKVEPWKEPKAAKTAAVTTEEAS